MRRIARFLSSIDHVEVIAQGRGVDVLRRLVRQFGTGRWRKMKGRARIELEDGTIGLAEIHWYEAHGIGRVSYKVKRMLE